MISPIHIVQGDHAAGTMRLATRAHALVGSVFVIPDDLSHGPLDDGRSRLAYMRDCWDGYGPEWLQAHEDAFAPWQALESELAAAPQRPAVIWHSGSAADHVFIRMACWRLAAARPEIWEVRVPPRGEDHGVGLHDPETLAGLALRAQRIADAERSVLAAAFAAMRERREPVRRFEDGRLVHVADDAYDALLLHACQDTWSPAARIVGTAMQRCDAHNPMSDLFFSMRLRHIIASGLVDAEGDLSALVRYRVRRRAA